MPRPFSSVVPRHGRREAQHQLLSLPHGALRCRDRNNKMNEALSVLWQNRKIWLIPLILAFLLIAGAVTFVAIRGPLPIPRLKV